ncbi:MAG: 2,3-butanediol dehydrogenase [Dehalococcoidales bacterium]|nr:2,3-butanediol dehydrogenase [Dehalococcoidales bacterium]
MKAAVWHGQKDVRVEDVANPPVPGKGEVTIKVKRCGICGSDLHEYEIGPVGIPIKEPHPMTGRMAPLIMGHEFSGDIFKLGEGVSNLKVGERVVASPLWYCGKCYWCRRGNYNLCRTAAVLGAGADGACAEYINVPAYTVFKLPPQISYDVGALVEPLSIGIRTVKQGRVSPGDTVAIWGAGPIGLFALQAARVAGATRVYVIEKALRRKECAAELGATAVLDPKDGSPVREIYRMTDGIGVDVALECVGEKETGEQTMRLSRRGGRVVYVGVFHEPAQVDFNRIGVFEREISGVFVNNGEFEPAIAYLADGRVKAEPLISQKITIDEINRGLEELSNHKEKNIKILVSFDG